MYAFPVSCRPEISAPLPPYLPPSAHSIEAWPGNYVMQDTSSKHSEARSEMYSLVDAMRPGSSKHQLPCACRAQLEQHHLRGSCGCGVRGLQAACREPGLSHTGMTSLLRSASARSFQGEAAHLRDAAMFFPVLLCASLLAHCALQADVLQMQRSLLQGEA